MAIRMVSLTEFRRNLSELIDNVADGRERIILSSKGKPKAAVISVEDLWVLENLGGEGVNQLALLDEAKALRLKIATRLRGRFLDSTELLREN